MVARQIAESVVRFAPEPVVSWCHGLNQEARYSSSVGGGGTAAVGVGKAIGNVVLRRKLKRARLGTAVRMPHYPVLAASATKLFLFAGPIVKAAPFAILRRDEVELANRRGPMWRRLDLIVRDQDGDRSYTIMFFSLFGNKRLRAMLAELGNGSQGWARQPPEFP
jgi:hypothetical protein